MKHILFCIFFLAVSLGALTAQAQVMTIHHTDGTTTSYNASDIEEITFDEEEIKTLPELKNQYGYDEQVTDIKTVLMLEDEELGYLFALYSNEDANPEEDEPVMTFALPEDSVGKTINLSTADMSALQIKTEGVERATLSGTLKVSFDKFRKNVTIILDSENAEGHAIRANWSGAFTLTYEAENIYTVTPDGYEPVEYDMTSVFRIKPASTGDATAFAFGNVAATTPDGLLSGDNAVWFSVSAAKVNTAIDLATDAGSYTFKYIDYATGTVYEEVTSGTITTAQTDGDKVYFTIDATLADGTTISGEYYGTVTDVESLDVLIPEVQYGNVILFYDSDGNETVNQEITEVKYSTSKDYTYNVSVTTLYFAPEGSNISDPQACPQLSFTEQLVNAGKLNLVDLEDGSLFKINYKSMQLTSHDDKKYYGYSTYPDNGTVEISRDDDGNYKVLPEVVNSYTTSNYNGEATTGGNNSKLILSYKGSVTAK